MSIDRKPEAAASGDRLLLVDQRKMLYKLAQEFFARRSNDQRQKDNALEKEYKASIAKEIGIDAVDIEIARLESQVASLKDKRKQMGFDAAYGGEYHLTGKAAKLLENRMSGTKGRVEIQDIEDETLAQLLLVKTVREAETLMDIARGKN